MQAAYVVGSRVDGLYDGNSDDMWYPGRVQLVHNAEGDTRMRSYQVLYDDGEIEHHVVPEFLRIHVAGTLSVGTRVFGRYAGGDEWYPGKVTEVQDNGCYTLEYDDTEVESDVPIEFIKEPTEAVFEPTAADEGEAEDGAIGAASIEQGDEAPDRDQGDRPSTAAAAAADDVSDQEAVEGEETPAHDEPTSPVEPQSMSRHDEDSEAPRRAAAAEVEEPQQREQPATTMQQQQNYEMERPRFHPKSKPADAVSPSHQEHHQQRAQHEPAPATANSHVETDEYASIVESIELLGRRLGDAASTKAVLSTLVKQMRAFPQVTADLVHERNGEKLVLDVLKFHDAHAVIQCYCFVLLRRLCFLCAKSTHFFLRNGIIDFVASAMRKFAEDAILQASACGALAVFTRVHAGLNLLLERRVAQLVLATIVYHKTYSIHTRQVHYYACEVLLELCELGDRTTLDALCGDQVDAGLSDVSPISLLLFLLRQGLSFDDKKACCAVGTLLMCLAASNRYAAGVILRLNGLPELSTVMAKHPSEPGIQKYSASASKEIALSSIQKSSPPSRKVKETASEILQESGSLEELHQERYHQTNGSKSSSRATVSGRSRTPGGGGVGKRKTAPVASYPSPTRGVSSLSYKDPLSFSKFASPIGKAPYLPSNMNSFAVHPSSMTAQQQWSSLVILDGAAGDMFSSGLERKQFAKEERQSLLFETYGVQGGGGVLARENPPATRTQGIKRKQLKTHIVSAAESAWATPVVSPKKLMRDEMLAGPSTASGLPFSSRSDIVGIGSFAPQGTTQRYYESMDESMDAAEQQQQQFYYQQQQQTHRSELSPTSGRMQQQQQPTKKKKKKKTASSGRESFQVRIESETQLRISREMRSPFASPISPSHKRSKGTGSSSRAGGVKLSVKSSSSSSYGSVQRASATKKMLKPDLNTNTESLTAYAAKLFNEDFGFEGDANGGSGADLKYSATPSALSAREQAEIQERERLSFAEKLHKMIDKAKSTLAVSNVTSEATSSRSSRSTTISKSASGSKGSSVRPPPPADVVVPVERPGAPSAVKKTRVQSGNHTPRKPAKEAAGEASAPSGSLSLSSSSQPKVQSQEPKKQSGSKISSLSTLKRPVAALPAASAKSTGSGSRASKPESVRLAPTPKSASKTKPPAASASKTVKLATPAAQIGANESSDGDSELRRVDAEDLSSETAPVETETSAAEASIEHAARSVSSEVNLQSTPADDTASFKENDVETEFAASQELQEQAESSHADESAVAETEQPVAADAARTVPAESEHAHAEEAVANSNDATEADDSSTSAVESHREERAAVEEVEEVAPESPDAQSEVADTLSPDLESPADAAEVAENDNDEAPEAADTKPAEPLDVPVEAVSADKSDDVDPSTDAAPMDDMYADEYNEFDDDAGGDEAAEALDELEEQSDGKLALDELLSMAEQVTAVVPDVPVSTDASGLSDGTDDASGSNPGDDLQSREAEESAALSSSKSDADLYADEATSQFDEARSEPRSARAIQNAEPLAPDATDAGAFDAAAASAKLAPEPLQTEDTTSPAVGSAAHEDSSPIIKESDLRADAESASDADDQESAAVSSVDEHAESLPDCEAVVAKESAKTSTSVARSRDGSDEESKDVVQHPETESSEATPEVTAADNAVSSSMDEPGVSQADEESVPAADELTEAELAEDRPASRGADSYADDGFDFEAEEEELEAAAEQPISVDSIEGAVCADQQKGDETLESGGDQCSPPVDGPTEPIESSDLPQEAAANSEAASEQDLIRNVDENAAHDEIALAAPSEAVELATVSEDTTTTSTEQLEAAGSSETAVDMSDAERIEKAAPAIAPDSSDAGDAAPDDGSSVAAEIAEPEAAAEAPVEEEPAADDAGEYGEDYGDADFEETENSARDPVAPQSDDFDSPPLGEDGVGDEAVAPDTEVLDGSAAADTTGEKQSEDDLVGAQLDTSGDSSPVDSTSGVAEPESSSISVASGDPSVPATSIPSEEAPSNGDKGDRNDQLPDAPQAASSGETQGHHSDDEVAHTSEAVGETSGSPALEAAANTEAEATVDPQVEEVTRDSEAAADGHDSSAVNVEATPTNGDSESDARHEQSVDDVGDASVVDSAKDELEADVASGAATISSSLPTQQDDLEKYAESYGDESEFVDEKARDDGDTVERDDNELPTESDSPAAIGRGGSVDVPASDPAVELNKTDLHTRDEATAEPAQESTPAAPEDPVIPVAAAVAEEAGSEAVGSESRTESAPPSAQTDTSDLPESEGAVAGEDESAVEELAYEDDYTDDVAEQDTSPIAAASPALEADAPVESSTADVAVNEISADSQPQGKTEADATPAAAPTENKEGNGAPAPAPDDKPESAEATPDVREDTESATDEGYDDGEFDDGEASGARVAADADPATAAIAETLISSAAEAEVADASEALAAENAIESDPSDSSGEGDVSSPPAAVDENADAAAAEDTAEAGVDAAQASPQAEAEDSADVATVDDSHGSEPAPGDSVAAEESGARDESETESGNGASPIIAASDESPFGTSPEEATAQGESVVEDPVALGNGGEQSAEAQVSELTPEESEEGTSDAAAPTEPETLPLVTEPAAVEASKAETSSAEENRSTSDGDEAQASPLEDASAAEELSKESDTQQSSPEFASYDGFGDGVGDSEAPPPSESESAPTPEGGAVESDLVAESAQIVDERERDACESEPPQDRKTPIEDSESLQVIGDGGKETEIDTQPSEETEPPATSEPGSLEREGSSEAAVVISDQDADATEEVAPTEAPDAADAETEHDENASDPVAESGDPELETVDQESTLLDAEPPVEFAASGEAVPIERDESGGYVETTAAGPDTSSSLFEDEETQPDDLVEAVDRAQADSVPGSEPSHSADAETATQSVVVDAGDEFASELDQIEPAEVTSEPETQLQAEQQQQPERDEAESPAIDQYDDFEAEAETAIAEIAVADSSSPSPAPESADAYDDFEAEAEAVMIHVQPPASELEPSAATPSAMGSESPGSDLYDDFEGNDDDAAAPAVASPALPDDDAGSKKPSEATITASSGATPTEEDAYEDEYADEAEYNDFDDDQDDKPSAAKATAAAAVNSGSSSPAVLSTESTPREVDDDDEPPAASVPRATAIKAKESDEPPAELEDEDYAVEDEEFEDDKPSVSLAAALPKPSATPATAAITKAPVVAAKPAQDGAENENEYEADYDAEYDDFED